MTNGKIISPPGHLREEFKLFCLGNHIGHSHWKTTPFLLGASSVGFLLRFGIL